MSTDERSYFLLSNRSYDLAKWLVQLVLPASAALYFGLASIWSLPAADQVVGTLVVITTFLGVVMGISTRDYYNSGAAYDGAMVITQAEEKKLFSLELGLEPEEIEQMHSLTFKVVVLPVYPEDNL